ncbi:hypothetical protein AAD018_000470 [Aestuariibius insulae]|uniref:hypothetical protein n=1 Tax=Aestuariibius insulae TaxID=2058287 RepID=UPI00345EEE12
MKHALTALVLLASPAQAACYADYKAKQDDPLRLHYGVVEISEPCNRNNARSQLERRLDGTGWQLLNVVSVFDESGLDERRGSAGNFFLRF